MLAKVKKITFAQLNRKEKKVWTIRPASTAQSGRAQICSIQHLRLETLLHFLLKLRQVER